MSKLTLEDISKTLRHIDICMMTTKTGNSLRSRPMSNNRQVDYNGTSYYFTLEENSVVNDIKADNNIDLSYIHQPTLSKNIYISITGEANLIKDKAEMEKHWTRELNVWFKQGVDTPGITLIEVKASHITYWAGMEEGELTLKLA